MIDIYHCAFVRLCIYRIIIAYPGTKEEAGANVTLHCKGMNVLIIKHNPAIYVIEQATTPDTWGAARVVSDNESTSCRLLIDYSYMYIWNSFFLSLSLSLSLSVFTKL